MAQTILRRIWSHCQCSYQLFKHKRSYFMSSYPFKDDLPVQCMSTYGQLYKPHLPGNMVCGQPNYRHKSVRFVDKKHFSTGFVHLTNVNVMESIDLETLKKQVLEEKKKSSDKNIHLTEKVKEIVAAKCDEIVANLGPEDEKKLKVIQLEHSFLYSEGYLIPSSEEMLNEYWLEAMKLDSKNQRLKYYTFLAKRSNIRKSAKEKTAAKKLLVPEEREKTPVYEHGRLFIRIYESTMKRWQNHRLASSMMYGIPLVIDMDYVTHMRMQEVKNTASQLQSVYNLNKNDASPFHLHLTSCPEDNAILRLFQYLQQEEQDILATVTENSFLDLFERENLVYLSPNARQVMKEFDPTAVYIIGAFNDKATMLPISYARAKEYNIKCQRLPLDEQLDWGLGSKNLTLDQMIKIMVALKNKKSWKEALTAIPGRKLKKLADGDK
ncbi:unnamed protein product [Candidula unifasciata]|uniref:RNA (guanine-9-)-methyltransferase domain-containing protein 1 n=1 Tax=Candidula unifasciata TaxID=100452 RepID=A0A8S3YZ39_9EUPU|nr:unnamed protein product [Candidula unifasciata]